MPRLVVMAEVSRIILLLVDVKATVGKVIMGRAVLVKVVIVVRVAWVDTGQGKGRLGETSRKGV